MYVYPIRGVRATQVDYIELGPYGIKYDREIILASRDEHVYITMFRYLPMSCLRQSLKGSKLQITTEFPEKLTEKGLPASLTLEMDIDPEGELGEFV